MIGSIDCATIVGKYSNKPFGNLMVAGFGRTYRTIEKTLKYRMSDPVICAEQYRHFLEAVLEDAYGIIGAHTVGRLGEDIQFLADNLPESVLPSEVLTELRTIKNLTSHRYVHYERSSRIDGCTDRNPEKDCKTLYVAALKVADWIVSFKDAYPSWKTEQAKGQEKADSFIKKLCWAFLGILGTSVFLVSISEFFCGNNKVAN